MIRLDQFLQVGAQLQSNQEGEAILHYLVVDYETGDDLVLVIESACRNGVLHLSKSKISVKDQPDRTVPISWQPRYFEQTLIEDRDNPFSKTTLLEEETPPESAAPSAAPQPDLGPIKEELRLLAGNFIIACREKGVTPDPFELLALASVEFKTAFTNEQSTNQFT